MKTWGLTQKTQTDPGNEIVLSSNVVVGGDTVTTKIFAVQEGLDAIRTQIDCNLQVIKGEVEDSTAGVDYFGIIFANTPVALKVQEITRVIMRCDGINTVKYERCEIDRLHHTMVFYFTIDTIYGELQYNKTFESLV